MVLSRLLRAGEGKTLKRLRSIVTHVNTLEDDIRALSDEALREKTDEFKRRYTELAKVDTDKTVDNAALDALLPEAFAVAREAARRTLGQRHFDVQIMGGAALHLGMIAEMKTGEGKTLTCVLPAYLNAISGHGVHVVTVNDYLAQRDAEWMGQIHRLLGLEVGSILAEMSPDERRVAYAADVTYGTNNEFGFDYLRDNMAWSLDECVQRGHNFAVVDEVDSILIDEARTPLIISGPADQSSGWYQEFARIAPMLTRDVHYDVDERKRTVGVTEDGAKLIEDQLGIDNLYKAENTPLVGFLNNAIKAKELYTKDKDYIIRGGEVLIVDEFTGRILHGRRYNEGMHQAIEAKERVEIKAENQTLATITLQNYFRLYNKLAGMTGTAQTEAAEFQQTYKLGAVSIPTNEPMIRADHPDLVYKSEAAKFEEVAKDIAARYEQGQPVLVGTTSVERSEYLSKLLTRKGVPHNVLNAKQHEQEAGVIAQAGQKGAVTIATNMAGRGTDIVLGGGEADLGADPAYDQAHRMATRAAEAAAYEKANAEATPIADDARDVVVARADSVMASVLVSVNTYLNEQAQAKKRPSGQDKMDPKIVQERNDKYEDLKASVQAGVDEIIRRNPESGIQRDQLVRESADAFRAAAEQPQGKRSRKSEDSHEDRIKDAVGNKVHELVHDAASRAIFGRVRDDMYDQAAYQRTYDEQYQRARASHDEVTELGGLYVLGTERHESRRIDDQLRGRSGRQGDPGESRFYLSLGDELMRRFNAAMVETVMTRMQVPDDEPIENKMVTRAIRSAQTQVEQQNMEIRKNVLKYDEVMDQQRRVIYTERRRVLEGEDLKEQVTHMLRDVTAAYVNGATGEGYSEDWDFEKLWKALKTLYPVNIRWQDVVEQHEDLSSGDLREIVLEDANAAYERREAEVDAKVGEGAMRELERRVVLSVLDHKWREHLYEMDYLKEGIGLRAMAQRDPLVEYRREGYDMFTAMLDALKEESIGLLFSVEVEVAQPESAPQQEPDQAPAQVVAAAQSDSAPLGDAAPALSQLAGGRHASDQSSPAVRGSGLAESAQPQLSYSGPAEDGSAQVSGGGSHRRDGSVNASKEPSRNEPCPCGSGKKYKKCHGAPSVTR